MQRIFTVLRLALAGVVRDGLIARNAAALTCDAVDSTMRSSVARGTLTRVDGRLVVTPPKTAQSRRVLPLAPAEVAMLAAHRRDQGEERSRAEQD